MAQPKPQVSAGTFKYTSIDHVSLLNYQPFHLGSGVRPALQFYGGVAAESDASKADLSSELLTPTSDAMSSFDNAELPDLTRISISSAQQGAVSKGHNASGHCGAGKPHPVMQLEECRKSLARAEEELALARKNIEMMRKHNANFAQELAKAEGVEAVLTLKGQWPGLVHMGSTPLLMARIPFSQTFDDPPRVVVGMQTSVPSAMVVVCTAQIDLYGFTVHAELANAEEVCQGGNDLLRCLVTWMAFGKPFDSDRHLAMAKKYKFRN